MSWKYSQSTGQCLDPQGNLYMCGFSGQKAGLNNPMADHIHKIGPIPRGLWKMGAWFQEREPMGQGVISLFAVTGTDTLGRDGFYIHGLNIRDPLGSSEGCIILGDTLARLNMWRSSDHYLEVTP